MTLLEARKLKALLSGLSPELFHGVTHQHEIARPDPYDVEIIHREAREQFESLLRRVSNSETGSGRILLLKGDSGSGKTHLMRVFRNQTHREQRGFFSYMQMTSNVSNYPRYLLRQTIDSLDQIYFQYAGPTTALMRLSDALAGVAEGAGAPPQELRDLRDDGIANEALIDLVFGMAERIVPALAHDGCQDLDLIRALLFLQPRQASTNSRVFSYLRCDPLTPYDFRALGGLGAANDEDEPLRRMKSLAVLIQALSGGALVVCLDQLEDIHQAADAGPRFRRAMKAAVSLAEVPNVLVILACLGDHYEALAKELISSDRDRIENDPGPLGLVALRTQEEVRQLIARRLKCLYSEAQVPGLDDTSVFPFQDGDLERLSRLRTRDVLNWCRERREKFVATRVWPGPAEAVVPALPEVSPLHQLWNDFQAEFSEKTPEDAGLLDLLRESVVQCAQELDSGHRLEVRTAGSFLEIDVNNHKGETEQRLHAGICNQKAQGRGLERRFQELERTAAGRTPVAIRTGEFPANPATAIARQIGEFIGRGGRRVVAQVSEWNEMNAFRAFRAKHQQRADFSHWLRQASPLSQLACLREILDLGNLQAVPPSAPSAAARDSPVAAPPPATREQAVSLDPAPDGKLRLGTRIGVQPVPAFLNPADLTRHAAFLGSTGSGKTTLALNCIEQLLLRGIPAILIDRKGDLCSYGLEEAWTPANDAPERIARRARLREAIHVAIYTPGTPCGVGRPLSIPIAPSGMISLATAERDQFANFSARALGGVLSYKDTPSDEQKVAILGRAIAVLSELGRPVTLRTLIDLVDSADPALLNAIGKLDSKCFKDIVQRLQTCQLMKGNLFQDDVEPLTAESLIGAGKLGGKARLSVINTSALGDGSVYWVAQFLLEITRYAARNPQPQLQAVILFDEADQYLPAQSKPATKAPLESLLKRARAAGIGLMLATQSPGDLDYKSRDQILSWFVGKVREETAIRKLEPLFRETKADPSSRLSGQQTGQFFAVSGGDVAQIQADNSLVQARALSQQEIIAVAESSREAGRSAAR
jgi:energy-coupling factor transporter ATP-binding protein EcfA2